MTVKRDTCEGCGWRPHIFGDRWYTVHEGRRMLKLCRRCLEDCLARCDAESAAQREWLEAVWQLSPRQVSASDDGGLGVSG